MSKPSASKTIYKICAATHWRAAQHDGVLRGTSDDLRDGYIHFSTAEQIAGTLAKHFTGETDLVLIEIDVDALGAALRWEPSRGEELFPHLYGELPVQLVRGVKPLRLGPDGKHEVVMIDKD